LWHVALSLRPVWWLLQHLVSAYVTVLLLLLGLRILILLPWPHKDRPGPERRLPRRTRPLYCQPDILSPAAVLVPPGAGAPLGGGSVAWARTQRPVVAAAFQHCERDLASLGELPQAPVAVERGVVIVPYGQENEPAGRVG